MISTPCSRITSTDSLSPAVTDLLIDGPDDTAATVVLAHGAGAPADSDFMVEVAQGLTARGLRCVRFEFPYMAKRRDDGKRRPPDRQAVLLETWHDVIAKVGNPESMIIGGKSMGGRMASLVADECGVAGLIGLGFPFHTPGKEPGNRLDHLAALATPTLLVQGTRDALGNREEVTGYDLSPAITIHWIEDGDHSLKPRKKSGLSYRDAMADTIGAIARFSRERTD